MAFRGARVARTSTSFNPAGSPTAITWSSAEFDVGGPFWAGGNPTRLTVPVAGKYVVGAYVGVSTNIAWKLDIVKVESGITSPVQAATYLQNADIDKHYTVEALVDLAANDYVLFRITAASTVSLYGYAAWIFQVR